MMSTQYEYMFAYTFMKPGSAGSGSGRVFFKLNVPVTKPEHIEEVEAFQNQRNGFTCAVVNFQLLRTIESDED